ncbi:unnamed protein product, partial [marine sediment metagenome]
MRKEKEKVTAEEEYFIASQWQLMWRKLKKHKLALFGGGVLIIFYILAIFCEFFSPYDSYKRHSEYIYCPPQRIHFFDEEGFHLRPFVYQLKGTRNPVTFRREYTVDKTKKDPIYFFVHGDEYKLWNLFASDIHFFGVKKSMVFL